MIIILTTSRGLAAILLLTISLLSKKGKKLREELRPFECGFSLKEFTRSKFSLQFFVIALIFLIFDVELILLFPLLFKGALNISLWEKFYVILFLIFLLLSLAYE